MAQAPFSAAIEARIKAQRETQAQVDRGSRAALALEVVGEEVQKAVEQLFSEWLSEDDPAVAERRRAEGRAWMQLWGELTVKVAAAQRALDRMTPAPPAQDKEPAGK